MLTGRRVGFLVSGILHLGVATVLWLPGSGPVRSDPADEPLSVTLNMFSAKPVEVASVATEPEPAPDMDLEVSEPPVPSHRSEIPVSPMAVPTAPAKPVEQQETLPPRPVVAEVVSNRRPAPEPVHRPRLKPDPQPEPRQAQRRADPPSPKPKPAVHDAVPSQAGPTVAAQDGAAGTTPSIVTRSRLADTTRRDLTDAYLRALVARIHRTKYYPRKSRRRGEEGTVLVRFVIRKDGRFDDVVIARSSGIERLDEAALKTLRNLDRFQPIPDALGRDDWPISVPIAFSLRR